jgi:phosphodiesterase/alkaline phosphatase D-like protein
MPTRPISITLAVLAALALFAPGASARVKGFSLGVTAAEVTSSTAVLWTRADKEGKVTAQISRTKAFGKGTLLRPDLIADVKRDNVVQTRVAKLAHDTRYYYRFFRGKSDFSQVGTFVTAPNPGQDKTVRFAFSGDADATPASPGGQPFYNHFETYRRMARAGNAFNINLGDTIYSDTEVGASIENGQFVSPAPALTKSQKWAKYRQNLGLSPLREVRSAASMYNVWDDHEFVNDFSKPEAGQAIFGAGATAFRDYMPVTYTPASGTYRTFRWGKNAELFFLDDRAFRSAKASANHVCDNPDTHAPDLAPLLPPDKRAFFGLVVTSLNQPVSQQCIDTIKSPSRTMLGSRQEAAFLGQIKKSTAKFKIVVTSSPIQQDYALPYDFWEGYDAERKRVLDALTKVKNVVFLSTDHHAVMVTDVRYSTFPSEGGLKSTGMMEFLTGPVATQTYAKEFDSATGKPGTGQLAHDLFYKPAPPDGLGMLCANFDVYSYAQVTVTSKSLKVSNRDQAGAPVTDGGQACPTFTVTAK